MSETMHEAPKCIQSPGSEGAHAEHASPSSLAPQGLPPAVLRRKLSRRLARRADAASPGPAAGPAPSLTGTARTKARLNVRSAATLAAENILGTVNKGTELHVLAAESAPSGSWYRVSYNGVAAYVTASTSLVDFIPSPAPATPSSNAAGTESTANSMLSSVTATVSGAARTVGGWLSSIKEVFDEAVDAVAHAVAPAGNTQGGSTTKNTHATATTTNTLAKTSTSTTASTAAAASDGTFGDADAAAVKDTWAKGASTSADSGAVREAFPLFQWTSYKSKAAKALKDAQDKKQISAEAAGAATTWTASYGAHEKWKITKADAEPTDPGAAPDTIKTLVGDPPSPAYGGGSITGYDVTMPSGEKYSYKDQVKSDYTINTTGVGSSGKVGGKDRINDVFAKAGVSSPDPATVTKVFSILSGLEGKFDAINTYDTGYVSVGFIQFVSGKDGSGSLASVLRDMKAKAPSDFATYFHSLGIDVDSKGLVVVDPATGKVLYGEESVKLLASDKRFAAAFQNAGAKSSEFQQAQARTAYAQYYAPDLPFSTSVKDPSNPSKKISISGMYRDVLLSEAGKVASVDRCVQRGPKSVLNTLQLAAQNVVKKHNLTSPTAADLGKYEAEIVPSMKNRYDVLGDANLTQPAPVSSS